jgi:hypothetical protein
MVIVCILVSAGMKVRNKNKLRYTIKNQPIPSTDCRSLLQHGSTRMYSAMVCITPWRQNAKFHLCIQSRPPPVLILSHLNPLYTPSQSPEDPFSYPSTPRSSKWALSIELQLHTWRKSIFLPTSVQSLQYSWHNTV